jgi:transposase
MTRTGCPWRYLPNDFPPWRTGYFARWRDDGTVQLLHDG